ncbi:MAG: hypothetical protein QOK47_1357 [Actinomycetota bacterium]|jgi:hypothetical protein|nr:hypothetical protein [Actinomycetota bacterium]
MALLALLVTSAPGGAKRYRSRTIKVAPGVTHTIIRDPRGPYAIHVVSARLDKRSTFDVELAQDQLPGFETTSSMARRRSAIVAINGDYARESGRPVMAFAEDGRLIQTPLVWGRNFAVNESETRTFVGHPHVSAWATEPDSGVSYEIDTVNDGMHSWDKLAAFTAEGGREEKPPKYACSSRLFPTERPRSNYERFGLEANYYVDETVCQPQRIRPNGGTIVSTPMGGPSRDQVAGFVPGDQVTLGWSLGWGDVFDTIGGNPTLVEQGRISVEQENDPFFLRHPRTGVGSTPDGRVLMVTVDGRQPGYSVGMTPRQFAELFISLGADYALNLDGGGSTTMTIRGRIVNRPSDGYQRAVSSALLLLPGPDGGEAGPEQQPTPAATPTLPPSGPSTAWEEIVTDPASTGGMASSLMREGLRLPHYLEKAAQRFRRN